MVEANGENEATFNKRVDDAYTGKLPKDLSTSLRILVVGSVSSGKSSLINALLRRSRGDVLAAVGAESGVTTGVQHYPLDERIYLFDSPGLADVRAENSDRTKKLLTDGVDIGLLVVSGSADASQRQHYEDMKTQCKKVFVVLNKVDHWDKFRSDALEKVIAQWKDALGVDAIYPTCAAGYDPDHNPDHPLDIRGVDALRTALEEFADSEGKALLLKRWTQDRRELSLKIIGGALVTVAGAALLRATQAVAITAIYYVYTGKLLSKSSALALIPTFLAETIGSSLFIVIKSFLPPTAVLDVAAAGVAVVVTAAMLLTVSSMLASGATLEEREKLRTKFRAMRGAVGVAVKDASFSDYGKESFWTDLLRKLMYS